MSANSFSINLNSIVAPENHLAVSSGYGTVLPVPRTVCGVGECYSPPLSGRGLKFGVAFHCDDHRIIDDGNYGKGDCGLLYAGGEWRPDFVRRQGTYHRWVQNKLVSLQVESRLAALSNASGWILEVKVRNRSGRRISLTLVPQVQPGRPGLISLDEWGFVPPDSGVQAEQISSRSWGNEAVTVHLLYDDAPQTLESGSEAVFFFALVLTDSSASFTDHQDWHSWIAATEAVWEERIQDVCSRIPLLQSSIPGLSDFYRRSLASGLVCIWEKEGFASNPYLTTSGIDGGGMCAYPWDICGYVPQSVCLLLGDRLGSFIDLIERSDLIEHSRIAPSGKGLDVPYAYSAWAIITFLHTAACQRGLTPKILNQARHVFEKAERSLLIQDDLADYGTQHNLLEMRGLGWEHIVASPNAERAWSLERIADMAEALGMDGQGPLREHAAKIRASIRDRLWNKEKQWFDCLHPGGHRELVYSIQVYDVLRHGGCTPEMEAALLGHVRQGAFLGRYGVSSISAEDSLHYEANDPDWSGSGSYFADGPNLAQTLWERGHSGLAWDVLQRYFWMGEHLPYFPQEMFCDRPAIPAHKRANIVAGLAGVESILFGMLGINLTLDGKGSFQPADIPDGIIELKSLRLRGHQVDLIVEPGRATAYVDGREAIVHPGERIALF